ncbi:PREDICTED: uncharacterized protein LOC107115600 [Gekko japonicus]|uniref:Uncharacterized protein LOC107115600 n=1 Tax=Gekko japonicus TaxID=146911 RepID=A0ABM1KGJ1_GEKJA|nr:PREDICTED: uncharacterized protein LOC107115600 [Gekko japonicus]
MVPRHDRRCRGTLGQAVECEAASRSHLPFQPTPKQAATREMQAQTAETSMWAAVSAIQAVDKTVDTHTVRLQHLEGRMGSAEKKLIGCERAAAEMVNQLESKWAALGTLVEEYGQLQRRLENVENLLRNRNFWILRFPPSTRGEMPKEWGDLDEQQKDLYKSVMKSNFETLVSLDYAIAKPEILSKIEQGQEVCARGPGISGGSSAPPDLGTDSPVAPVDVSSWLKQEVEERPGGIAGPPEEARESSSGSHTGASIAAVGTSPWIKEEVEEVCFDPGACSERALHCSSSLEYQVVTVEDGPVAGPQESPYIQEPRFLGEGPSTAIDTVVGGYWNGPRAMKVEEEWDTEVMDNISGDRGALPTFQPTFQFMPYQDQESLRMAKRKADDQQFSGFTKKKRNSFKSEWLTEFPIKTMMPHVSGRISVQLKEIFEYRETDDVVVCKICLEGEVDGNWSTGKKWDEWKIDYLKRHVNHKCHLDAVTKLQNQNQNRGLLQNFLKETPEDQTVNTRIEYTNEDKWSGSEEVKILIDNVLLAVKLNVSMLSVQEIHDHMAKYVKIPASWRSKNYAFEFIGCINSVVKSEILNDIRESPFHTLIIDGSTEITVSKMLIMYIKFRKTGGDHKTVFAGIVKLAACNSAAIVDSIRKFYDENHLDMNRMVMFTSDGASVMLGKRNGVAALLRESIPHLLEQHCVVHREDLGIDDAWKTIPFIKKVETLIRTVYTVFSRSSVRKAKLEEITNATNRDVVSFRPLNEIRWLSRHFAVSALVKNYDILIEYCKEQVEEDNDPVHKYCLAKLSEPQYKVALFILCDVLGDLAELCRILQKSPLTTVEAFQFTKEKIRKIRSQYLGDKVYFSETVRHLISSYKSPVNIDAILCFIRQTCDHMDRRFPENELEDWSVFDNDYLSDPSNLDDFFFGNQELSRLAKCYCVLFQKDEQSYDKELHKEYSDFKLIIAEKIKAGATKTFQDMLTFTRQQEQFSELNLLLEVCGTFQASSADCERGFSLMNAIKTKNRNRLDTDHLENLLRIKLHMSNGNNINIDSVYHFWRAQKGRREKLN